MAERAEAAIVASQALMDASRRYPDAIHRPTGNSLVFDTETTDLPGPGSHEPHRLVPYERCRIVSVAWRVLGPLPELATLRQGYHIVRPEYDFESVQEALRAHGIDRDRALREGEPLGEVLGSLLEDVKDCEVVVAHNAQFDVGVVLSELFRLQRYDDVARFANGRRPFCTLLAARVFLRETLYSCKLGDVYRHLTGEALQDAHNADADTAACATVYASLLRRQPQPPPQPAPWPRGNRWLGARAGPGAGRGAGASSSGASAGAAAGAQGSAAALTGPAPQQQQQQQQGGEAGAIAAAKTLLEAACTAPDRQEPLPVPRGSCLVLHCEVTADSDSSNYDLHAPHQLERYGHCRIESVAWRVLRPAAPAGLATLRRGFRVVRRRRGGGGGGGSQHGEDEGEEESEGEEEESEGESIGDVMSELMEELRGCEAIVMYNAPLILGAVLSELLRPSGALELGL
ncbi:hypothetical protein PLESTF_000243400 [Pleodorina starrii]|nr:hypothetical protein PLESTM_001377900 [Pleodorina starrii]GLC65070.1 hypothetical protein PLESTF_000243400 [Pleodorina starrii]